MKTIQVVVPSWASLTLEMQNETGVRLPAFVMLAGLPLYAHILNSYREIRNYAQFIFVLPLGVSLDAQIIAEYDVSIINLEKSTSLAQSVFAALNASNTEPNLIVHMADTLLGIECNHHRFEDAVYVKDRHDLYRWTSIIKTAEGPLLVLNDRNVIVSDGQKGSICVGVFKITDRCLFRTLLSLRLNEEDRDKDSFFSALEDYSLHRNVELREAKKWSDFGHIDTYYQSRMKFHNLRHFNTLDYDSERGLVTKRSTQKLNFRNQVRWYKQIPDELLPYLPRVYASNDGAEPEITMELLPYPTLSELYVSKRLDIGLWNEVGKRLKQIKNVCRDYGVHSDLKGQLCSEMYLRKTKSRILTALNSNKKLGAYWIWTRDKRIGLESVLESLEAFVTVRVGQLDQNLVPIHGDLCFTNIMYESRSRMLKLIDPRGEFGVPGIYGDQRYDLAKLVHSYEGGYDFIVSDCFKVNISKNQMIECTLPIDVYHRKVGEILNSHLFDSRIELEQSRMIQALLFISMLPLHVDRPDRQAAMLCVGLNLFFNSVDEK